MRTLVTIAGKFVFNKLWNGAGVGILKSDVLNEEGKFMTFSKLTKKYKVNILRYVMQYFQNIGAKLSTAI